jgi:hypothetical protein
MWARPGFAAVTAVLLAACAGGGGPPLSSKDKLFLQKVEELGGTMTGDRAQADALAVGRTFCVALRSGTDRTEAQQSLYATYPAVSVTNILDAANAANLVYCPETQK